MKPNEYLPELAKHLLYLYSFARQINELDFAASLSGESRGAQDAGWNTTITAYEVHNELSDRLNGGGPYSKSDIRIILMLYCQLAEAGGVYETIKNIMGAITLKPYVFWPFQELVRTKKEPRRVIGPNANSTFRNLATTAKEVGLSRLSYLLETAFRDDIRNGIYHADYILWEDGLRLRNRNGGYANRLSYDELGQALTKAVGFLEILMECNRVSVTSFNPPKTIVGRFSLNFPMPWTVSFNPETGSFELSGSSPGPVITPEYQRQLEINGRLGGKVLAIYSRAESQNSEEFESHLLKLGFEPNSVAMDAKQFDAVIADVERLSLWDERKPIKRKGKALLASPWGFRWLEAADDFNAILPSEIVSFAATEGEASVAP